MARTEIRLKGTDRRSEPSYEKQGICAELINLRRHAGEWVGVKKKKVLTALNRNYDVLFAHQTSKGNMLLGYSKSAGLFHVKITEDDTLIHGNEAFFNLDVRMASLGNVLLVFDDTNQRTVYFLYEAGEDTYRFIGEPVPDMIRIAFGSSMAMELPEPTKRYQVKGSGFPVDRKDITDNNLNDWLAGVHAKCYNEMQEKGHMLGWVMVRSAWRLYDGTHVGHSPIAIVAVGDTNPAISIAGLRIENTLTYNVADKSLELPGKSDLLAYHIPESEGAAISAIKDRYKGIVVALDVFVSRLITKWDNANASYEVGHQTVPLVASPLFKSNYIRPTAIQDEALYLLKSIPMDTLAPIQPTAIKDINYNLIHTKDTLPTEPIGLTLYGRHCSTYNSRLFLSQTTSYFAVKDSTLLRHYAVVDSPYYIYNDVAYDVLFCFEYLINTAQGVKSIRSTAIKTNRRVIALPFLMFFPDSRASDFRVLVRLSDSDPWRVAYTEKLIPHTLYNYAYGMIGFSNDVSFSNATVFTPSETIATSKRNALADFCFALRAAQPSSKQALWSFPSPPQLDELPTAPDGEGRHVTDINRIQASEVENPFVFQPKNSYRVGKGCMIATATNTLPLSALQFGQHPLIAFSEDGIWALEVGTGDALVVRISPLSDEVCTDPNSVLGVGNMVIFRCRGTLMAVAGGKVHRIADPLHGRVGSLLKQTIRDKVSEHVLPSHLLSSVPFEEYLQGAHIGVNYTFNEVIVSNPLYKYSYIFNTDDNVWYKRSDAYERFVHAWPTTLCVLRMMAHPFPYLIEYSTEEGANLPVYIETRDLPIEATSYAKMEAAIALGEFYHNGPVITAMLGSGHMESKHFVINAIGTPRFGYNDRLPLGRAIRSVKYFRFVLAGVFDAIRFDKVVIDVHRDADRLT